MMVLPACLSEGVGARAQGLHLGSVLCTVRRA